MNINPENADVVDIVGGGGGGAPVASDGAGEKTTATDKKETPFLGIRKLKDKIRPIFLQIQNAKERKSGKVARLLDRFGNEVPFVSTDNFGFLQDITKKLETLFAEFGDDDPDVWNLVSMDFNPSTRRATFFLLVKPDEKIVGENGVDSVDLTRLELSKYAEFSKILKKAIADSAMVPPNMTERQSVVTFERQYLTAVKSNGRQWLDGNCLVSPSGEADAAFNVLSLVESELKSFAETVAGIQPEVVTSRLAKRFWVDIPIIKEIRGTKKYVVNFYRTGQKKGSSEPVGNLVFGIGPAAYAQNQDVLKSLWNMPPSVDISRQLYLFNSSSFNGEATNCYTGESVPDAYCIFGTVLSKIEEKQHRDDNYNIKIEIRRYLTETRELDEIYVEEILMNMAIEIRANGNNKTDLKARILSLDGNFIGDEAIVWPRDGFPKLAEKFRVYIETVIPYDRFFVTVPFARQKLYVEAKQTIDCVGNIGQGRLFFPRNFIFVRKFGQHSEEIYTRSLDLMAYIQTAVNQHFPGMDYNIEKLFALTYVFGWDTHPRSGKRLRKTSGVAIMLHPMTYVFDFEIKLPSSLSYDPSKAAALLYFEPHPIVPESKKAGAPNQAIIDERSIDTDSNPSLKVRNPSSLTIDENDLGVDGDAGGKQQVQESDEEKDLKLLIEWENSQKEKCAANVISRIEELIKKGSLAALLSKQYVAPAPLASAMPPPPPPARAVVKRERPAAVIEKPSSIERQMKIEKPDVSLTDVLNLFNLKKDLVLNVSPTREENRNYLFDSISSRRILFDSKTSEVVNIANSLIGELTKRISVADSRYAHMGLFYGVRRGANQWGVRISVQPIRGVDRAFPEKIVIYELVTKDGGASFEEIGRKDWDLLVAQEKSNPTDTMGYLSMNLPEGRDFSTSSEQDSGGGGDGAMKPPPPKARRKLAVELDAQQVEIDRLTHDLREKSEQANAALQEKQADIDAINEQNSELTGKLTLAEARITELTTVFKKKQMNTDVSLSGVYLSLPPPHCINDGTGENSEELTEFEKAYPNPYDVTKVKMKLGKQVKGGKLFNFKGKLVYETMPFSKIGEMPEVTMGDGDLFDYYDYKEVPNQPTTVDTACENVKIQNPVVRYEVQAYLVHVLMELIRRKVLDVKGYGISDLMEESFIYAYSTACSSIEKKPVDVFLILCSDVNIETLCVLKLTLADPTKKLDPQQTVSLYTKGDMKRIEYVFTCSLNVNHVMGITTFRITGCVLKTRVPVKMLDEDFPHYLRYYVRYEVSKARALCYTAIADSDAKSVAFEAEKSDKEADIISLRPRRFSLINKPPNAPEIDYEEPRVKKLLEIRDDSSSSSSSNTEKTVMEEF